MAVLGLMAIAMTTSTAGADGAPACATLVQRGGRVLARSGNVQPFEMASLAKPLTALAALILVQEGQLTLDDDVHRWLPELPDYGFPITLRQMLTHTAGLRDPDPLFEMGGRSNDQPLVEQVRLLVRQKRLNHAPGTVANYSNGGFVLAAELVQRRAGEPFEHFVARRIFGPLGMKDSRFVNGRWIGSLDDLAIWDRALDGERILGVPTRELWKAQLLADGGAQPYALGWQRAQYRGLPLVEKDGAWRHWLSDWLRFPTLGLSVIALCDDGQSASLLTRQLADAQLDVAGVARAPSTAPRPNIAPPSTAEMASLAGTYLGDDADALEVRARNGALWAAPPDLPPLELTPLGGLAFVVRGLPITVTVNFTHERNGSLRVDSVGPDRRWSARRVPLSTPALSSFVGDFHSDDLGATYHLRRDGQKLTVQLGSEAPDALTALDAYTLIDGPFIFRFARDFRSFELSRRRALHLAFVRVP